MVLVLVALALSGCQVTDCRIKPAVQVDDGAETPADIQGDSHIYRMSLECRYHYI